MKNHIFHFEICENNGIFIEEVIRIGKEMAELKNEC